MCFTVDVCFVVSLYDCVLQYQLLLSVLCSIHWFWVGDAGVFPLISVDALTTTLGLILFLAIVFGILLVFMSGVAIAHAFVHV